MTSKFTLPQEIKVVEALSPAADAAGRAGDYVSLKNWGKAFIIAHITQGNAAQVTLTVEQASSVAPSNSKAITNAVRIWANEDCAAGDALVRQTDAISFQTSAALKHKMIVFEIDPALLDVENGFDCVVVKTSASNAANITQASYLLCGGRYAQATPPSAIVD